MSATKTIHWIRDERFLTNSLYEARLTSEYREHVQTVMEAVWTEIERLEQLLSPDDEQSTLLQLNREAGRHDVEIDYEMVAILEDCQRWYRRTGGYYDVTAGHHQKFCPGIDVHSGEEGLPYVVDRRLRTVRFNHPSVQLDLDGYRQAYALDSATHVLLQFAVFSGFLSVGPLSLAIGQQPSGEPWVAQVPNLVGPDSVPSLGDIGLVECALCTLPVPRLLTPQSGPSSAAPGSHNSRYPDGQCTVIAATALEALALCTAAANMGRAEAAAFAEEVFTPQDGISIGWGNFDAENGPQFEWLVEAQ